MGGGVSGPGVLGLMRSEDGVGFSGWGRDSRSRLPESGRGPEFALSARFPSRRSGLVVGQFER